MPLRGSVDRATPPPPKTGAPSSLPEVPGGSTIHKYFPATLEARPSRRYLLKSPFAKRQPWGAASHGEAAPATGWRLVAPGRGIAGAWRSHVRGRTAPHSRRRPAGG